MHPNQSKGNLARMDSRSMNWGTAIWRTWKGCHTPNFMHRSCNWKINPTRIWSFFTLRLITLLLNCCPYITLILDNKILVRYRDCTSRRYFSPQFFSNNYCITTIMLRSIPSKLIIFRQGSVKICYKPPGKGFSTLVTQTMKPSERVHHTNRGTSRFYLTLQRLY